MRNFIVYNRAGKILRTGLSQDANFLKQAVKGEFVMDGVADDITQKIVNGKVVDKAPGEIPNERLPLIPESIKPANVTNEQWRDVLKRLDALERKDKNE